MKFIKKDTKSTFENENFNTFFFIVYTETPNDIIEEDSSSALDLGPVSLGKRCRSSIECQIRDPYSACINGICECLSRTSKCNSLNPGKNQV